MKNEKGLTLVEVVLSLCILSIVVIGFNQCYHTFQKSIFIDTTKQETGQIAKDKMEEIKSKHLYINDNKHSILGSQHETISFQEGTYKVDIFINPLDNNHKISYVNVEVSNFEGERLYNLIRYVDLQDKVLPMMYEEFNIDTTEF